MLAFYFLRVTCAELIQIDDQLTINLSSLNFSIFLLKARVLHSSSDVIITIAFIPLTNVMVMMTVVIYLMKEVVQQQLELVRMCQHLIMSNCK